MRALYKLTLPEPAREISVDLVQCEGTHVHGGSYFRFAPGGQDTEADQEEKPQVIYTNKKQYIVSVLLCME